MRVLLSTSGSRRDVQPLVALAAQLRELGQQVRVCVPPDFCEWIDGMGIPVVPIGPHLRPTAAPGSSVTRALSSPEQRRLLVEGTVAAQFGTISQAAEGCDAIIGRLDGARATLHVLDIARASSGRPGPGPAGRTRGPGAVFGAALAGTGTQTRRRASDPHDPQARDPLDGGEVVILRDDR